MNIKLYLVLCIYTLLPLLEDKNMLEHSQSSRVSCSLVWAVAAASPRGHSPSSTPEAPWQSCARPPLAQSPPEVVCFRFAVARVFI